MEDRLKARAGRDDSPFKFLGGRKQLNELDPPKSEQIVEPFRVNLLRADAASG
jgi:hypothetical protein